MLLNCGVGELLRVPWIAKRSNQSILKEVNLNINWKDWCWSWNFNTLATWCKELTHLKRHWCWERLKVKEKGTTKNKTAGWHHQLYGHEFEQAPDADDEQGKMVCCSPWGRRVRHDWMTERKYMTQKILKFCFPYSVCNVLYYISLFEGRNKLAQITGVQ